MGSCAWKPNNIIKLLLVILGIIHNDNLCIIINGNKVGIFYVTVE